MCMYSNDTNTSVIQSICKYSNCSTKANSLPFTWPEKQLFNSPVTFLVTFNFVPKQQQFSDKKLLSWAEQILLILIYCLSRLGYDASQHFRELLRSIQKNVYSQTVSYSTKLILSTKDRRRRIEYILLISTLLHLHSFQPQIQNSGTTRVSTQVSVQVFSEHFGYTTSV